MDFVDEQHVALFEIGEKCGEIAGLGDHGPGSGAKADAEFARDDLRQRGLAEAGGTDEQHVVERLAPLARGLDEDREVGARLRLANELGQQLRTQRSIADIVAAALGRDDAGGRGHAATRLSFSPVRQVLSRLRKQWPKKRPFITDEAARLFCEGYRLLNVWIGTGVLAVLFVGRKARKAEHRQGDVTRSFGWQEVAVMNAAKPRHQIKPYCTVSFEVGEPVRA